MVSVRAATGAVIAAVVYAAMWLGYRQGWPWLSMVDCFSLTALHDAGVKHSGWLRFWQVLCTVLGPVAFRLLTASVVLIALVRRRVRVALFLVVAVELSGLVTQLAKEWAGRPRPATALVAEGSLSFPSGHALGAMAGVVALGLVWRPTLRRPRAVAAVGALIVLAVGFGRVALNVHYPSDVLAGWALGYLYVALCAQLIRPSAPHTAAAVRDPS